MVKKVIANLDSSRVSGADYIPVAVLKNCEPELSYIPAELFNMCLKESCFPDFWKVSSVVPVCKNIDFFLQRISRIMESTTTNTILAKYFLPLYNEKNMILFIRVLIQYFPSCLRLN